jgi:hypothetical protein
MQIGLFYSPSCTHARRKAISSRGLGWNFLGNLASWRILMLSFCYLNLESVKIDQLKFLALIYG